MKFKITDTLTKKKFVVDEDISEVSKDEPNKNGKEELANEVKVEEDVEVKEENKEVKEDKKDKENEEELSASEIKALKELAKNSEKFIELLKELDKRIDKDTDSDEDEKVEEEKDVEVEKEAEGEDYDETFEEATEEPEEEIITAEGNEDDELIEDNCVKSSYGSIETKGNPSRNDSIEDEEEIAAAWAKRYGGNK